jgi:ribonuclease P protein component
VRKEGRSFAHPFIVLIALKNDIGRTRIGVAAGRSVGGAVQRNRSKRRLRAILFGMMDEIEPGWDLVWIARHPLLACSHPDLELAVNKLLGRARIRKLI